MEQITMPIQHHLIEVAKMTADLVDDPRSEDANWKICCVTIVVGMSVDNRGFQQVIPSDNFKVVELLGALELAKQKVLRGIDEE